MFVLGFDYCFTAFLVTVVRVYEECVSSTVLLVVCFDDGDPRVAFRECEVGSAEIWEFLGWLGLSHLFPFAGRDGKIRKLSLMLPLLVQSNSKLNEKS